MTLTASYPLKWPAGWDRTAEKDRRSSYAFKVTFDQALKELRHDLELLGATSIVLSSYLPLGQRGEVLGGSSRTRMEESGVAIYFFRREREYVLAQDAFDSPLANLRSIGLALQGLRQLERHGGAHLAERAFGGFVALPPPPPPKRPWREVFHLAAHSDADPALLLAIAEATYKTLAKRAHPDAGGNGAAMEELNNAIQQAREELRP